MIKAEEIDREIREKREIDAMPEYGTLGERTDYASAGVGLRGGATLGSSAEDADLAEAVLHSTRYGGRVYQVYEVTYKKSMPVGRTLVEDNLTKQEARDLVRELRDALDKEGVLTKGYGFEVMRANADME